VLFNRLVLYFQVVSVGIEHITRTFTVGRPAAECVAGFGSQRTALATHFGTVEVVIECGPQDLAVDTTLGARGAAALAATHVTHGLLTAEVLLGVAQEEEINLAGLTSI
jgi:hypothetical protein